MQAWVECTVLVRPGRFRELELVIGVGLGAYVRLGISGRPFLPGGFWRSKSSAKVALRAKTAKKGKTAEESTNERLLHEGYMRSLHTCEGLAMTRSWLIRVPAARQVVDVLPLSGVHIPPRKFHPLTVTVGERILQPIPFGERRATPEERAGPQDSRNVSFHAKVLWACQPEGRLRRGTALT